MRGPMQLLDFLKGAKSRPLPLTWSSVRTGGEESWGGLWVSGMLSGPTPLGKNKNNKEAKESMRLQVSNPST